MDVAIYGMMRSGTTLLSDKLTSRPSALVLAEANLHLNDWGLHTLKQLQAFGIPVSQQDWISDRWESFEVFFRQKILPHLDKLDFWGVKLVNFTRWRYFLDTYRPQRLILCVRDVRDVALSRLELAEAQGNAHVFDSAWTQRRILDNARQLVEMSKRPHLLVRYEDLCTDPQVMPRILEYVGRCKIGSERIGLEAMFNRDYERKRHGDEISARTVYRYSKETGHHGRKLAEHIWQQCPEYCTTFGYESPQRHVSLDSSVIECHAGAQDILLGPHAGQPVPITRTAAGENLV